MSETYTIGGNALQKILFGNETAQTFTPLEDHILHYFDIDVFLNSERGIPVPHLYRSDETHEPVGGTASHATSVIYTKPFKKGLQRIRAYMQPYPLKAGKVYCIKIYGLGTEPEYTFYWQYDKDDAQYPRGHRIWRNTEFDAYTHYYDQDYIFTEFGTPPLPKPEPTPPIDHFATVDIHYIHSPISLKAILATSVPCHLTCYYTDKKPLKHHQTATIRGLTVPWHTYFCFVAWKEIEQLEPGDTLYHTFQFGEWTTCQTKWFTFRGEVHDLKSPSVGPIFSHHHPGAIHVTIILRPNAPGDETNYPSQNPPAGEHWDKVDEAVPDEGATCIEILGEPGVPYYRDLFNLPSIIQYGTIDKITVYCRWWKIHHSTAGAISIKPTTTVYESPTIFIDSGEPTYPYETYSYSWANNPDTGQPWKLSDLQSLQIGTKQDSWWLAEDNFGTARCTQIYIVIDFTY